MLCRSCRWVAVLVVACCVPNAIRHSFTLAAAIGGVIAGDRATGAADGAAGGLFRVLRLRVNEGIAAGTSPRHCKVVEDDEDDDDDDDDEEHPCLDKRRKGPSLPRISCACVSVEECM